MAELNIADVIANHRRGSHVLILQIPFDFNGKKIEAIEVGPFTLGHRKAWRDGFYKSPTELMVAVCADPITHKMLDPLVLDNICNPDDERLEYTFMSMLPHEMRESVLHKQWPGSLVAPPPDTPISFDEDEEAPPRRRRREPEPAYEDREIDPNTYTDEPMREDRGLDIG